ncbi:hypothetical protein [Morganella morganii]|uniref:hypothetical protein n=1 Tax=Morganella morganii TaxID=582 RepID=UPI001BDA2765|nr:hypothetical protein [Morganella morganii]MBT0394752.1 hypothetical protein [Morganella morganii subsp. morganii]MBT0459871.1 hypothetical protein [Morganella morganii subsp. morganii]MDR5684883.1 hypothetical protein [Morganella morganii]
MKKTSVILTMISSFLFPQVSYAKTFTDRCGAYVKETYVDKSSDYRFKLVDSEGNNFDGSQDWSFSSTDLVIIEMLNSAHLSQTPLCIDYSTSKWYWTIYSISMQ